MNYLAIGLVIIIVMILYNVYYYLTNTTLTSGLQELSKQTTITYDKLKQPSSYTYSYQCWLYLSNPANKQIFYRGPSDLKSEFEVDISGQELILKTGTGAVEPTQTMTITSNFPIQKWTYLVVNVYNLQTFEAYINGKLSKTVNVSKNKSPIPSSRTSSLYIGNGELKGYVTKFTRTPEVLDAKTVWEKYIAGNGLSNMFSSLIPYGLNLSISKGEEIQRVVSVF